jgi:hypothetical protein
MRFAPAHPIRATSRESKVLLEHADDHDTAARRKPQSTRTAETTIAIPTVLKPIVTTSSCHGRALWPAPIIGERLAVPKIAASVVAIQFPYVPYSTLPPSGVEKVSPRPDRTHRDERSPVHNSFQMRGESHPRVIELLLDKSGEHARSTDACYPRHLSSRWTGTNIFSLGILGVLEKPNKNNELHS